MKKEDMNPSEAAAAAIEEQEDILNSSLYDRFNFEGELEQFEDNIQRLFENISEGVKGKVLKFDDCSKLEEKTIFDERSITKATLAGWLVTALETIHHTKLNMRAGNSVMHRLKNEKIEDKETIIRLQGELIKKQKCELTVAVQDTLKTEMKSYSEIVTKNCSTVPAITPSQLKTAVREAVTEEDRSKNLMVFGLDEEEEEDLREKITGLVGDLQEKPQVVECK